MCAELSQISLNKFLPGEKPLPSLFSTWTVYGKRRTGKSVFVKWNMQYYKHEIPWYWVFTKTKMNSHYASFLANNYIFNFFNNSVMDSVMARQENARAAAEGSQDKPEGQRFNPRAAIVWDDYSEKQDIRFNDSLATYYYTGRHFFTMNYFCAQHIKITPPAIRTNTDIAVLFNTDNWDTLEEYHKSFAGKMPKAAFFAMFFEAVREDHNFMVIDNNPNTPYQEKFYVGKAEELDEDFDYVCGCREFWQNNLDQLKAICEGAMKVKVKLAHDLAEHHQSPYASDFGAERNQGKLRPEDMPLECPGTAMGSGSTAGAGRKDNGVEWKNVPKGLRPPKPGAKAPVRPHFQHAKAGGNRPTHF